MRTYITPEKMCKINPDIPDTCIKCTGQKGTLFHCLWECIAIQNFWRQVIGIISRIISKKIPICPKLCILGLYPETLLFKKHESKMVDLFLIYHKCLISTQ